MKSEFDYDTHKLKNRIYCFFNIKNCLSEKLNVTGNHDKLNKTILKNNKPFDIICTFVLIGNAIVLNKITLPGIAFLMFIFKLYFNPE